MQHDSDKKVGKNDGSNPAENLQADRIWDSVLRTTFPPHHLECHSGRGGAGSGRRCPAPAGFGAG
ncbi:uncharacterized protein EURHEDRAFT_225262 [Aspergillus ruber CBS 135680]|uniref:Uncharacterized protein n=1 Tax=Aspergillus ruber (strain CBS 135680) TaxID=1388766 RepID=A0A017S754_ASPRC|nr:uncharacterized protein EURHEDRAFT_225262 [Aspergillus ruber CBS 135680]EYE91980.1 hypothetical protein EURHEDRAFT_225262 [Aspergillus ruber CBS 135680]